MEANTETLKVFYHLSLYGIDLSITAATLAIWGAALVVFLVAFLATRKPTLIPGKMQNFVELIYEFLETQTEELLGNEKDRWMPFLFCIFCFIVVANLFGLIPGVYPITANINVSATLAVIVFIVYNLAGIRAHGARHYFKSMIPKGIPIFIMPFMFLIEILGHLARPFSLAIRLFANMTAGHLVAFTILSMIFVFKSIWVAGFPLLGKVAINLFDVFISLVQGYVFAYLAALYIGLAINEE